MTTRFHTVFFDMDGTLVDHFEAIHRSHCHTRHYFGLSEPSMDDVHRAVGAGVDVAIARVFADRPDLVSQAIPVYKAFWDANMLNGVRLLPGARELLEALKRAGVCCAVLTNKHGPSSRKVCEHLGIAPLLAGNFGAKDTPWLKPQIEFTVHALSMVGVPVDAAKIGNAGVQIEGVCLIGDSEYDAQTGIAAGFPCYCVTTGTHDAKALHESGATAVFPDLFAVGREAFGLGI